MWKLALLASSLAFAGAALAIVPQSTEITGRVIDAETKRPLAAALVIASIGGPVMGWSSGGRRKLHCDAVLTNAEGRFAFPAWKWSANRGAGQGPLPMVQFGAVVTAYHPDHVLAGERVFQALRQVPLVGTPLKPSSDLTVSMRRFSREDRAAWRKKLTDATYWYECDWDGDVGNTQLFWDTLHPEVEEYTRLTGDDAAGGPMYKLKWVTKRPVTEYQRVIESKEPARIAAAKVASAGQSAGAASVKIARVSPDPAKPLRVGDRVSLRVDVEYNVASDMEVILVVQADTTLLSNTRGMLKGGSGTVTLTSDFVVPDAEGIRVYTPLALRGGRDAPDSRTFKITKPR